MEKSSNLLGFGDFAGGAVSSTRGFRGVTVLLFGLFELFSRFNGSSFCSKSNQLRTLKLQMGTPEPVDKFIKIRFFSSRIGIHLMFQPSSLLKKSMVTFKEIETYAVLKRSAFTGKRVPRVPSKKKD